MSSVAEDLATAVQRLKLADALKQIETNDLLPPRPEDGIHGRLRAGWISDLEQRLTTSTYWPSPAIFVQVPKSVFATRPAALLQLTDRVVYEALSSAAAEKIERSLPEPTIAYWPRGADSSKKWLDFEQAALVSMSGAEISHVVKADISGFYESIDHSLLQAELLKATGWPDLAAALVGFLGAVMGSPKGLPQGLAASDRLASLYLVSVDSELGSFGSRYVRHGDDLRLGCTTYEQAREACHLVERAVRRQLLLPNSSKLTVLRRATYERELRSPEALKSAVEAAWRDAQAEFLLETDGDEALIEMITELGLDDLGWALYHGMDTDEIVSELRDHLSLDQITIGKRMFQEAFTRRPGGPAKKLDQLASDDFHQRIVVSLNILMAADDSFAVEDCQDLLRDYPDKTEIICRYLQACSKANPGDVYDALRLAVLPHEYMLGWQRSWMLYVMSLVADHLVADDSDYLRTISSTDRFQWVERVSAIQLLAKSGRLDSTTYHQVWQAAPTGFRTQLIEAAAGVTEHWAVQAVGSAHGDAVLDAIVNDVRARSAQSKPRRSRNPKLSPKRS